MTFAFDDQVLNGKYRLEARLGAGAFGEVYRAVHVALQAPRALKVLRRDAPGVGSSDYGRARERFELEAQLGAQLKTLNAEHVIEVYDFEDLGDVLALVMEYAAGGSLGDRLAEARREQHLPGVAEALRVAREVATGLAALHGLDAVHRDVKPSNILFDARGSAKLVDFGLAQVPGGASMRSVQSIAAPHPGTPAYMSPEQRTSSDHLTPASDVYALGAVLFEMLTGRVWRSARPGSTARGLRSEVPDWLSDLLARCLAATPEGRPWDGTELLELLKVGEQEATRRQREAKRQGEAAEAARRQREAEHAALRRHEADARAKRQEDAAKAARRQSESEAADRRQREAAEAEHKQAKTLRLASGVELAFVEVPAGPFLMGSDPRKDRHTRRDEQPQRQVTLDRYWMGKTPVTNAQYAAFVAATGHRVPDHWMNERPPEGKEAHPVVHVSWEDAVAFCSWASELGHGEVRLPTEAEWEKAARGTDGRPYPWGDAKPDATRCSFGHRDRGTTEVGRYSPQGDSPLGCVDMVGNVWEWCLDWWADDYYESAPDRNPQGPAIGKYRVLRGGSWSTEDYILGVTRRYSSGPVDRGSIFGFRCAGGAPGN